MNQFFEYLPTVREVGDKKEISFNISKKRETSNIGK